MRWNYIKPLENEELISEYEKNIGYIYPAVFRTAVKKYNGGYPEKSSVDAQNGRNFSVKRLLSFNRNDKESVWRIGIPPEEGLADRFAVFALADGGDLFCFEKATDKVFVIDHETLEAIPIASGFTGFQRKLYD